MNGNEQTARPFQFRRRLLTGCDALVAVAAAVAISALALEYGFYDPLPVSRRLLHVIQACVLAVFVIDRLLHLGLTLQRRQYLRHNWLDFSLIAIAAAVAVAVYTRKLHFRLLSVAAMYVIITQVYILAMLVTRLVGFQIKVAGSGINPMWVLIGSFAVAILFGTGLLMLPRAAPADPVGVQVRNVPENLADLYMVPHTDGALVTGVIRGTAADEAGIKDDDFIVAVEGAPVRSVAELRNRQLRLTPARRAEFTVYRRPQLEVRGGPVLPRQKLTVPVTIASTPVGLVDALFTGTSATCVTGLLVRDTATEYTTFGQVVILTLIQLGGLGIMVFGTVFALLAGRQLSIRESLLAERALAETSGLGQIARMVKFAVVAALSIELVGAAIMYPMWRDYARTVGAGQATFRTAFHAVSAFCNAGFSLQPNSLESEILTRHWQVIGVMAPLIFLGGLGFPVLYDVARYARTALSRMLGRSRSAARSLTLHSRLVLTTSAGLVVAGALVLVVIEQASHPGQTFGHPQKYQDNPYLDGAGPRLLEGGAGQRTQKAIFQSITARTAGFNTFRMDSLSPGGKLWMCLLMIVGGSPASTAGGLKTVTVAVLVLTIWSMLRRRQSVEGFRRTIAEPFIRKAVTLAGLYLGLVMTVTLLLCVTMYGRRLATGQEPTFIQLFFEACSACGTVGLSCGVTQSLTTFGKYVIIAGMFIGRLGPLTVLMALTMRLRPARYAYPTEEVVLG